MKLSVPKGKYVLAVSGGVDSMALLDMLAGLNGVELVVAHFNHGIRQEAGLDEALVRAAAKRYGLVFEFGHAALGPKANEDDARQARYKFLGEVVSKHKAIKIITAHHQDDWIETALINLVRGTGRQGVSAMLNNPKVLRPLINVSKAELVQYAKSRGLAWNEDSTNYNLDYLRNQLRALVVPKLTPNERLGLIKNLDKVAKTNIKLDKELATLSHKHRKTLNRQQFSELPTEVGQELIVYLLRQIGLRDYDQKTINRLSLAIKTAKPNSIHSVKGKTYLDIKAESANFVTP